MEARDQTTINYVISQLVAFEKQISASFGAAWASQVVSDDSIPRSAAKAVPQALNPAVAFTTYNLRPFGPTVVTPAVSIGLIYLIVLAFFSFSFYLPIHVKFLLPHKNHPPLHFSHWILWRWCATVVGNSEVLPVRWPLYSHTDCAIFHRAPISSCLSRTQWSAWLIKSRSIIIQRPIPPSPLTPTLIGAAPFWCIGC